MNYSDLERYNMPPLPTVKDSFCVGRDCDQQPFVGWEQTIEGNEKVAFIFSQKNINYLSQTITEALRGVDPEGRDIIIPDDKICNVLNSVFRDGTRPNIGDIYTRYIIPPIQTRNDIMDINNQTIAIIVDYIKNEIGMTENNKKLTVWNSLYGDFNEAGLRAHPTIKIRKRHPQYMAFNMNY